MLDLLGLSRVPAQGTYTNLFIRHDVDSLNRIFHKIGVQLAGHHEQIAVDGKTLRGSLRNNQYVHVVETRRLYRFQALEDWMDWPGLTMGLAVHCTSVAKCSGKHRESLRFGITSLPPDTDPAQLLDLFRNHWGIENR